MKCYLPLWLWVILPRYHKCSSRRYHNGMNGRCTKKSFRIFIVFQLCMCVCVYVMTDEYTRHTFYIRKHHFHQFIHWINGTKINSKPIYFRWINKHQPNNGRKEWMKHSDTSKRTELHPFGVNWTWNIKLLSDRYAEYGMRVVARNMKTVSTNATSDCERWQKMPKTRTNNNSNKSTR